MNSKTYLALILSISLVFSCSKTFGDERTKFHIAANYAGTLALYGFLNAMGKAGTHRDTPNAKEMLVLAVPMMLVTGFFMEAAQSTERNAPFDLGDFGANALGVGLAAGTVFVFDL